MKEVKMFILANCPHCKKASQLKEEIFSEHPEFRDVPLKVIDEGKEPAYAEQFDYYYVPTFYVGDVKMCEGVPTEEGIEKVFEEASK